MIDSSEIGLNTLFRFAKALLKDWLYDILCYAVGWCVLRVLTAGRHAEEGLSEGIRDPDSSESLPNIMGLVILLVGGYLLFK